MVITYAGITGLLCSFGDDISVHPMVSAFDRAVHAADLPGVMETIPAYTSVLVRYDALITPPDALAARLEAIAAEALADGDAPQRVVEIPVHYGGADGPDLPFVAEHAGLTEAEVIRMHHERVYPIYMLGFLPGFPYLGGLDPRLHTPRLPSPRTKIPAGSVGIGGSQTGIYPLASPGGWRLIGRTPLKLFTPGKPLPYQAGDAIRFVPVDEATMKAMEATEDSHEV